MEVVNKEGKVSEDLIKNIENENEKIHTKNIESERLIENIGKARPGCVIRFNYQGKDVHDKNPLVLLLNTNYQGKMHGLALRKLSEVELTQLTKLIRTTWIDKVKGLVKKSPDANDMANPFKFYHNVLKSFLKNRSASESCYRTYVLSNVSGVRIIDYKFNSMDKKLENDFV